MPVGAIALLLLAPTLRHDRSTLPLERLRIGYAVEAPYAFLAEAGEPTGESPALARLIAGRIGIRRIDWIQTSFDMLLTDLEMNRFDVVAAGMFVTPERVARVAFSQPTFHARQALLVRRGNPRNLHSYADAAATAGVTIAVVAGSVEAGLLSGLGMADERLLQVPDAVTGKSAVATGLADGLALSSPTVRWMAAQDRSGAIEVATPFRQSDSNANMRFGFGAFAFRPGDHALRNAWNAAMPDVVGSAEHLQAVAPFGFTRDEIEDLPTLEGLLQR